VQMLDAFDADYSFIDNIDTTFYFRTDLDAPRGRIIAIDIKDPQREHWREIVPESADRLVGVNMVNNQLIASYLKDAHSHVKIYATDGKFMRDVELPGIGSASGFGGKRHETETFYSFTSFTRPATIYRYDLRTGTSSVFREPKVKFNPDDYESKQVFYNSKDGTRVPMFIIHKKGLKLNGKNSTCLYGYGGFDISLTPGFSSCGWKWAAFLRSQTCAAAANTAKNGITPARNLKNKTCSTISSPRLSGSSPTNTPPPGSSRSAAAATAACSSVRA
jgi:prolyl oligopeptidase